MEKGNELCRTVLYTLAAYLLFFLVVWGMYALVIHEKNDSFVIANESELSLVKYHILEDQNNIIEDLDLFSRLEESKAVLSGDRTGCDGFAYFATMLISSRSYYDQIRLLDLEGREVVRVDYHDGNPAVVPQGQLQDKSGRYYFREAQTLAPGGVYISPFDLNAENGALEIPLKPMIRYVKPVLGKDGKIIGYAVINYLARQMFERIDDASEKLGSDFLMVNDDGYYLYGMDEGRLWGDQLDGRMQENLRFDDPPLWSAIEKNPSGHILGKRYSRFFNSFELSETVRSGTDAENIRSSGQRLVLVYDVSRDVWLRYSQPLRHTLLLITGIGMLCIPMLAFLFARMRKTNESLLARLQKDASIDPLTGVLNRRTGFAMVRRQIEQAKRSDKPLSICYLDIDSLKSVNDTLGHDFGDLYLLALVELLQRQLGSREQIIRLGGDEFLVVVPACSMETANRLLDETNRLLRQRSVEEHSKIAWSFSYGVVLVTSSTESDTEALVKEADRLMYMQKQKSKSIRR